HAGIRVRRVRPTADGTGEGLRFQRVEGQPRAIRGTREVVIHIPAHGGKHAPEFLIRRLPPYAAAALLRFVEPFCPLLRIDFRSYFLKRVRRDETGGMLPLDGRNKTKSPECIHAMTPPRPLAYHPGLRAATLRAILPR